MSRTCYLSVTEAPHDTEFYTWMGKKHFCLFQTAETGNRTPNSSVEGSGANHCPRLPGLQGMQSNQLRFKYNINSQFYFIFIKVSSSCSNVRHQNNLLLQAELMKNINKTAVGLQGLNQRSVDLMLSVHGVDRAKFNIWRQTHPVYFSSGSAIIINFLRFTIFRNIGYKRKQNNTKPNQNN